MTLVRYGNGTVKVEADGEGQIRLAILGVANLYFKVEEAESLRLALELAIKNHKEGLR